MSLINLFLLEILNARDLRAWAWSQRILREIPRNEHYWLRKSIAVYISQFVGTRAAGYLEYLSIETSI